MLSSKRSNFFVPAVAAAVAVTLAGCAAEPVYQPAPQAVYRPAPPPVYEQPAYPQPAPRPEYRREDMMGTVSNIEVLRAQGGTSGGGAVLGAVIGGVLGNQVGAGRGREAATVLGAVGGGIAGNEVEKNRNSGVTGFRIYVRLDNGASQAFDVADAGDLRQGDRVRVDGNRLSRE